MPANYAVLAPVYDEIGMADFARVMTPRLLEYAQSRQDWVGRRILDLGCGTGVGAYWLAQQGYTVLGVDYSPEMLDIAQRVPDNQGLSLNWQQGDVRELNGVKSFDLAIALGVFNEFNSLRELEAAFTKVRESLDPGRFFIFDMLTIQGLAERGSTPSGITYDNGVNLLVFSSSTYDYERQMHDRNYIIFQRDGQLWQRSDTQRVLRAFPVQAVATLLQRAGFTVAAVLNLDFAPFDPASSSAPHVIFMVKNGG